GGVSSCCSWPCAAAMPPSSTVALRQRCVATKPSIAFALSASPMHASSRDAAFRGLRASAAIAAALTRRRARAGGGTAAAAASVAGARCRRTAILAGAFAFAIGLDRAHPRLGIGGTGGAANREVALVDDHLIEIAAQRAAEKERRRVGGLVAGEDRPVAAM